MHSPLPCLDCSNPASLHCKTHAAADSEALVDLGAYGRSGPWRAGVLLGRLGRRVLNLLRNGVSWFGRGPMACRPSRGSAPRQIQEQGVLRALDPESEAEVVEDPCQAVQVGLELQGVTKALAVEDCSDRAASEPTRLLDQDQELSDLGGSSVARLCNHHSQLYMLSCQGRKCSVLSCYGAVHGAHRGAPLCRKHLAETARSFSPASTGPRTPNPLLSLPRQFGRYIKINVLVLGCGDCLHVEKHTLRPCNALHCKYTGMPGIMIVILSASAFNACVYPVRYIGVTTGPYALPVRVFQAVGVSW